jgi:hypothetical protein
MSTTLEEIYWKQSELSENSIVFQKEMLARVNVPKWS